MSNSIIEVKNISKKYNITHEKGGYAALRDVLTNIAKNPFKFAKHKAKTSASFISNADIIAKVYFPRLILPISGKHGRQIPLASGAKPDDRSYQGGESGAFRQRAD